MRLHARHEHREVFTGVALPIAAMNEDEAGRIRIIGRIEIPAISLASARKEYPDPGCALR
jgi:hypothetical protein